MTGWRAKASVGAMSLLTLATVVVLTAESPLFLVGAAWGAFCGAFCARPRRSVPPAPRAPQGPPTLVLHTGRVRVLRPPFDWQAQRDPDGCA